MSRYHPMWEQIQTIDADKLSLSYREIESILGFPIDHSFLTYKKELPAYDWNVKKISMKEETVLFERRIGHA